MVVETPQKGKPDFDFNFACIKILKMCINKLLLYKMLKLKKGRRKCMNIFL